MWVLLLLLLLLLVLVLVLDLTDVSCLRFCRTRTNVGMQSGILSGP